MVRKYIVVGMGRILLCGWFVRRIVCVCVVGYLMGRRIGRYVIVSMGDRDWLVVVGIFI